MTDRIVGYASNLAVVMDNGAGMVRVVYPPWELDWEWFNALAVGHWLANVTTAVTATIAAKGGTEWAGYWFDLNVAFPSANWNTGNRISPQRQAGIFQYNTFATAIPASANDDTLLMWYRSPTNSRYWEANITTTGLAVNVWGMLSRCQLWNADGWTITGNLLAQAVQAKYINLGAIFNGFEYIPTAGQAGAGLLAKRCFTFALTGFTATNHTAGTVIWEDCKAIGSTAQGFLRGVARNCTAMFSVIGFNAVEADLRNLVAAECGTCFTGGGIAGAQYCADTDGTLPVHATNLRNQNARTQLRFFRDLASPGRKKFPFDARIHFDSVLKGAGVSLAPVTVDADGQVRPNPPSIGAWEPYAEVFAPGAAMTRGARKRGINS